MKIQIYKLEEGYRFDVCGNCKEPINQIEIEPGVYGCPHCNSDNDIIIYECEVEE